MGDSKRMQSKYKSCTTSSFLEPILVTVLWEKKKGMRRALQNRKCLLKTHTREKIIAFLVQSRCMQNFHVRIKSKIETYREQSEYFTRRPSTIYPERRKNM